MDKINKFETLTLSNNKEYIVFDILEKNNEQYLYLVNENDNEVLLVKTNNEELIVVKDENLLKELADEILKRIGE